MIEFKLNDVEEAEYKEFCERHRSCEFSSTIGGKITLEFQENALEHCPSSIVLQNKGVWSSNNIPQGRDVCFVFKMCVTWF